MSEALPVASGRAQEPARDEPPALAPDRETRGALSQLVEVLLDKGVYLDLDLVVTVAEVPLIGVNLRATIAGAQTMIEYGLLGAWGGPGEAAGPPVGRHPAGTPQLPAAEAAAGPEDGVRGDAWYREPRAGTPVWRRGTLVLDPAGGLRWQGSGDRRAALRLAPEDVSASRIRSTDSPGGDRLLEVRFSGGMAELAGEGVEEWAALLEAAQARREGGRSR